MHDYFSHLAGYNHLEVAEYLLETGADVNAQDKGGLIPLHNASSYGVSTPAQHSSVMKTWDWNYLLDSTEAPCCFILAKNMTCLF